MRLGDGGLGCLRMGLWVGLVGVGFEGLELGEERL